MKEVELDFKRYLSSRKLKYTPERQIVLREVLGLTGHFDADGLLLRLKSQRKVVSRATVYRTLDLLVKLGVLRRVCCGDKTSLFENNLAWKPNGHLVCLACGEILQFEVPQQVDKTVHALSKRMSFRPQNRSLEIFGYCDSCYEKAPLTLSKA